MYHNTPLMRTIVGSHLFKMNTVDSDVDFFQIHVVPSRDKLLDIGKSNKSQCTILPNGDDLASHEIGKVIKQLLSGNINFIQGVTTPLFSEGDYEFYRLLKRITTDNIAKNCFNSINGLTTSNYKKYLTSHYVSDGTINADGTDKIIKSEPLDRHSEKVLQKKTNIIGREIAFGINALDGKGINYTTHKHKYDALDIPTMLDELRESYDASTLQATPDLDDFYELLYEVRMEHL